MMEHPTSPFPTLFQQSENRKSAVFGLFGYPIFALTLLLLTFACGGSSVNVRVSGVQLNKNELTLSIMGYETLRAHVLPVNALSRDVTWTSSDEGIATVSNGTVTGLANGEAIITVATVQGGFEDTCVVKVVTAVTGVTLTPVSLSLAPGATNTLTVTIYPSDATNKTLQWTSSNTNVATVNNGAVTGVASGTATITVRTEDGGHTATCAVTVRIPVTSITLSHTSLTLAPEATATLTATVEPANATNKTLQWTSSNTSAATVSPAGVVTAVANGTAAITARSLDNANITATCTVNVRTPGQERVYVAGTQQNRATLWVNGTAISIGATNTASEANSVYAADNAAYIAGYQISAGREVATLWKYDASAATPNTTITSLALNPTANDARANAVYVQGTKAYVAGYEIIATIKVATLWTCDITAPMALDGSRIWSPATVHTEFTSIHGSGDNTLYLTGQQMYNTSAPYLVSGRISGQQTFSSVQLTKTGESAYAKSVFVSGGYAYAAGDDTNQQGRAVAKLWRYDLTAETQTNTVLNTSNNATAASVCVSEGVAYVAGSENIVNTDTATIWKFFGEVTTNIRLNQQTIGNTYPQSLFVLTGELFTAGYESNTNNTTNSAILWRCNDDGTNPTTMRLSTNVNDSKANSVFVAH